MSRDTNQLIAELSQQAARVQPMRLPHLCGRLVLAFAGYCAVLVAINGVRADLPSFASDPLFMVEIIALSALVLSSLLAAAVWCFPDRYQHRLLPLMPLPLLLVFFGVLLSEWMHNPPGTPFEGHGLECLSCITFYAVVPGLFLFWHLRQMATVHAMYAGSVAVLASFSLGALALRLVENTDDMVHLISWHYAPMLGMLVLGMFLGRWLLKW